MLLLAGLIGLTAGCGPGQKARGIVKGKVTFMGKALPAGTVTFMTSDNRTGSSTIDTEGHYTINDAPVGDVQAIVSVPKKPMMMGMPGGPGPGGAKPPPGIGEMKDPAGGAGMKMPTPPDPTKIVAIPDKYADFSTSGLTFKVTKGEQTIDIELK